MTWKISAKSWAEFPPGQKWFAIGEALSHLNYLRLRGKIRREMGRTAITHTMRRGNKEETEWRSGRF
jgi:hypothetical protein